MRDEAISLAKRATQVAPRRPFGYAALSTASQDFSERMESLEKAASLSTEAHLIPRACFLVRLLVEPREDEAREVQGKIGGASRDHPSRRGLSPKENSLYSEITKAFEKAWALVDLSVDQKEFLSKHEYRIGLFFRKKLPSSIHQPRARRHLGTCQEQRTSNYDMASFWLATLVDEAGDAPCIAKCPANYIVGLYSTFAARFDELLVEKLNYQTPTKLRELMDTVVDTTSSRTFEQGLDLGCGTGLSGLAFSDVVNRLTGVDLSPEMIERATETGCYEKLEVADVISVLHDNVILYDLVLACDVFCYIGDLSEVFTAVSKSLSNTGFFCFSTEQLEESAENPYRLHACARFAHKRSYLEELSEKNGFQLMKLEISSIRKNQGQNVRGLLAVLKLSAVS
jgi:predicted TPR repeat methyltransferase